MTKASFSLRFGSKPGARGRADHARDSDSVRCRGGCNTNARRCHTKQESLLTQVSCRAALSCQAGSVTDDDEDADTAIISGLLHKHSDFHWKHK